MTSQKTGNFNGKMLEDQIETILISKGYFQSDETKSAYFIRQYRKYNSIYGTKFRLDFFVRHKEKWSEGLALECKWQSSAGSVDEKYPYVILNMKSLPCPSAVLLAGGKYSPKALKWLMNQADERLVVVEGLDSILKYIISSL